MHTRDQLKSVNERLQDLEHQLANAEHANAELGDLLQKEVDEYKLQFRDEIRDLNDKLAEAKQYIDGYEEKLQPIVAIVPTLQEHVRVTECPLLLVMYSPAGS